MGLLFQLDILKPKPSNILYYKAVLAMVLQDLNKALLNRLLEPLQLGVHFRHFAVKLSRIIICNMTPASITHDLLVLNVILKELALQVPAFRM